MKIITAEELKKKIDGNANIYLVDVLAPESYEREEELIAQAVKIMDHIDLNNISMREKFEAEVERMRKFQRSFIGASDAKPQKAIDLRDYAKYLLREGSVTEKRELLLCIKNRLVLTKGEITLQS